MQSIYINVEVTDIAKEDAINELAMSINAYDNDYDIK